ncbi:transcription antitermination factor NusB [Bacillus massiliigorillae]|uniref:transcription antitermination factor NusB n=1 Tax=Bacillus massiliigorillae TaxID=1243664 RepID=UPI0003A8E8CF|nr:transcription antitermination factor NusB [Bacillus massiliigorillae]
MKRRTAREKALQALFQIDIADTEIQDALNFVIEDQGHDEYLDFLVKGTMENVNKIDEIIASNLENWTIARLSNIDRNILRIATFEMLKSTEVPVNVVIDEGIEIAKAFGDDQSSKFVNAVLSKIKEHLHL